MESRKTKVDIITGFLGAGKTTFIKAMLDGRDEKIAILENEFGKVAIDGALLSGLVVKELSQGCICCSLIGDFREGIAELIEKHAPDRIIIEPTGVAMLTDVFTALEPCAVEVDRVLAIADARRAGRLAGVAGAFYSNQLKNANAVALSKCDGLSAQELRLAAQSVAELSGGVPVLCAKWDERGVEEILAAAALFRGEREDESAQAGGSFSAWGKQDAPEVPYDKLAAALEKLKARPEILRVKGILQTNEGAVNINGVPGDYTMQYTSAQPVGICVIGMGLNARMLNLWYTNLTGGKPESAGRERK